MLGLIVVADAPGRLPRPLAALVRSLRAGDQLPQVWRAPWVEAWRLGERPTTQNTPPAYRRLLADLYDRSGDVPQARRLFREIQINQPGFADVEERAGVREGWQRAG